MPGPKAFFVPEKEIKKIVCPFDEEIIFENDCFMTRANLLYLVVYYIRDLTLKKAADSLARLLPNLGGAKRAGPPPIRGGGPLHRPLRGPSVGRRSWNLPANLHPATRGAAPGGDKGDKGVQDHLPRGGDGSGGTAPTGAPRFDEATSIFRAGGAPAGARAG